MLAGTLRDDTSDIPLDVLAEIRYDTQSESHLVAVGHLRVAPVGVCQSSLVPGLLPVRLGHRERQIETEFPSLRNHIFPMPLGVCLPSWLPLGS
nr:hypothetical protein Itr_chr15CG10830 [Ipomoea trifida]